MNLLLFSEFANSQLNSGIFSCEMVAVVRGLPTEETLQKESKAIGQWSDQA